MKVILLEELPGKGGEGDVIEVARGFANHLMIKGAAIEASKGNLKQLEQRRKNIAKREEVRIGNAEQLKAKLEAEVLTIKARVGDEGILFGSVTAQMIADAILKEYGFEMDIASDAVEAVRLLREAPAETYDVILMDIQMPNMDGYEAARIIRRSDDEKKANIPIVAVTANAFEEDRKLALEAGMNGHLAKPYDIPKMLGTLRSLLFKEE